MTWDLAEDLGKALGPVALLTGHPDTLAKGSTPDVQLSAAAPYQRAGYARRALSWLHYLWQAFVWLWGWPAATPLLLFSNPPLLPWLGYLMRRLRSQRYTVMVHDVFPDSLVSLGILSGRHPVTYIWRRLNRLAYEHADAVMTLGEYMAANLKRQYDAQHTSAGRVEVVYPWADTEFIHPIPKGQNWFAQKHGQVGKLTLLYSGNMGISHDIETMLAAAHQLRNVSEVHFMFIGCGAKWGLAEETIRAEQLFNVTLLPWQSEEVLPYSLATADVTLVSLEKGIEGLAVPSKAVYAMAAGSGLLVLTHGENELASWVGRYQCGMTVEPGDVDELVQAVHCFLNDSDSLRACRQRARQAAERDFSRQANTRRIQLALVTSLGNGLGVAEKG